MCRGLPEWPRRIRTRRRSVYTARGRRRSPGAGRRARSSRCADRARRTRSQTSRRRPPLPARWDGQEFREWRWRPRECGCPQILDKSAAQSVDLRLRPGGNRPIGINLRLWRSFAPPLCGERCRLLGFAPTQAVANCESRTCCSIIGRNHGIVGGQVPFGAVLVR